MWTFTGLTSAIVVVLSWFWRRGRGGFVLPAVASALGALLLVAGAFDAGGDKRAWMIAVGIFGGLLPGTSMLCLALVVRAERRPWLLWPAILAGLAFLACVVLLLGMWIAPKGGMPG